MGNRVVPWGFAVIVFVLGYKLSQFFNHRLDSFFELIWEDPVEAAKRRHALRIKELHAIPAMNEEASREILAAEMGTDRDELEKYLGLDTISTLSDIAQRGNKGLFSAIVKAAKKSMRA